jgi:pyruvate formate lyase activating enzyme
MNIVQGIKGFLGISLIDYPGKVAAVIFLSGCNLRCPYCHNSALLDSGHELEDLQLEELVEALKRRAKLLDGIVVTGGEPTVHPQLFQLLRSLKSTGLSVKLDTNGMRSDILAAAAGEGLVDYMAVDIKLAPERYSQELQAPADAAHRLGATVDWLRASELDYEFRTTCVPGLVRERDIEIISRMISGASAYYLQQYVPLHVPDSSLAQRPPYSPEVLERFMEIARPHVKEVGLRNL